MEQVSDYQETQNSNSSGNYQMRPPLPNATAVFVLGILSIFGCFCFGFVGIILAIIAVYLSNRDRDLYFQHRDTFSDDSWRQLNTGRTIAIVGLSLSVIYLAFILIKVFILGMAFWALFGSLFGGWSF